jgi:hypothetical protein
MKDIKEQLELIMSGVIPAKINEKTEIIKDVIVFISLGPPSAAVIIAEARINYFEDDCRKWQQWIDDNFHFEDSYIYKLLRSGTMMLDVIDNKQIYRQLFELSIEKLAKLSTIKRENLEEFLNSVDAKKLNIEEFREAVDRFLGKEKQKKAKEQMLLPGFEDAINGIARLIEDEFDFSRVVRDAAMQDKAIKSGKSLLGAAIAYEYEKTIPNTKLLENLQKDFLESAEEIKGIIAKNSPVNMISS